MSERYRLVFRGEVLEGQHKAVVKQRLGVVLKVDGERLDALFTGKAVTIRKEADSDTAARFQIAFKRAGARLRVVPVALAEAPREAPPETPAEAAPATPPVAEADAGFRLAPLGATLVEPRPPAAAPALDLSHLTLAALGTALGTPSAVTGSPPDTSHLSLAALGAIIGITVPPPVAAIDAPEWEISDVGVDLMPPSPDVESALDVDAIDFELSPLGTWLMDADDSPPPAPPDTSHLRIQ
jgi:hypothetical protein